MRCGCSDIIVPLGNSWTNIHLLPLKSEETFHAAPHQDTDPQGKAGRDVLECGCLVNSLNVNLQDQEVRRPEEGQLAMPVVELQQHSTLTHTNTNTALNKSAKAKLGAK